MAVAPTSSLHPWKGTHRREMAEVWLPSVLPRSLAYQSSRVGANSLKPFFPSVVSDLGIFRDRDVPMDMTKASDDLDLKAHLLPSPTASSCLPSP